MRFGFVRVKCPSQAASPRDFSGTFLTRSPQACTLYSERALWWNRSSLIAKVHMTNNRRISPERIAHAAAVIDPVFLNSPQFLAESLGNRLGCRLVVKVETLNPIRSFKGRGAEYFVSSVVCR